MFKTHAVFTKGILFSLMVLALFLGCSDGPTEVEKEDPLPVAALAFSPLPGEYSSAQEIEITCVTIGARIRYTTDGSDPVENYHTIKQELAQYSKSLADKPEIVIASKMDLDPTGEKLEDFAKRMGREVFSTSSVTGTNVAQITEQLWQRVQQVRQA